ncbi:MAG: hypothetical protein QM676_01170 [Novosphingobium sp.]
MADPDRALRRMVAELAEMPAAAGKAVLDRLTETQRDRVRALLDEYHGEKPAQAPAVLDRQGVPAGLSPWLLELLGLAAADPAEGPGARSVTPSAIAALKACAAELGTAANAAAGQPGSGLATIVDRLRPARWRLGR